MYNTIYASVCLFALSVFFPISLIAQTCTDPNLYADECDFDGDGILNVADIDDDNDGVLDTTEQDCFLSNNLTDGLAAGFHPMDTWLLTHGIRIRHIDVATLQANTTDFRVLNHPSWVAQGDPDNKLIWNGTGISIAFFAPDGITAETSNSFSIYSDPIPITTGLVRVIARDINGVDILDRFDPDGSQHSIDITQTGGIAIHEVVLSFSSSAFDLVNITGSCLDRDTDNDTFADRFDLDSDGDGCSDAFESGATTDISVNFQFADLAADADGLSPSVDPGGDGEIDYTSTYAPDANDNSVNNCPSVLSVNIFNATLNIVENDLVEISWESEFKEESQYFEIMSSQDGQNWEKIARLDVVASNEQRRNYVHRDSHTGAGSYFYRIAEVDKNGARAYSNIMSVNFGPSSHTEIMIYPNPFENELLIKGMKDHQSSIELKDIQGKSIKLQQIELPSQAGEVKFSVEQLPKGFYFLRIGSSLYKLEKK